MLLGKHRALALICPTAQASGAKAFRFIRNIAGLRWDDDSEAALSVAASEYSGDGCVCGNSRRAKARAIPAKLNAGLVGYSEALA